MPIRYLALVGALATEADFVFIPEWPPEANWPETMCEKLKMVDLHIFLLLHLNVFVWNYC